MDITGQVVDTFTAIYAALFCSRLFYDTINPLVHHQDGSFTDIPDIRDMLRINLETTRIITRGQGVATTLLVGLALRYTELSHRTSTSIKRTSDYRDAIAI